MEGRLIQGKSSNLSNYQGLDYSIYQVSVFKLGITDFKAIAYLNL